MFGFEQDGPNMPAQCQQLDLWWNQCIELMQFVKMTGGTFCVSSFFVALLPISVSSLSILVCCSLYVPIPLSLHTTLPNLPLGFPLTERQPGRIYPSEIKRGEEKKPMGASWGKIAYPGVNPRTGAQVNRLPALRLHSFHSRIPTSQAKWEKESVVCSSLKSKK